MCYVLYGVGERQWAGAGVATRHRHLSTGSDMSSNWLPAMRETKSGGSVRRLPLNSAYPSKYTRSSLSYTSTSPMYTGTACARNIFPRFPLQWHCRVWILLVFHAGSGFKFAPSNYSATVALHVPDTSSRAFLSAASEFYSVRSSALVFHAGPEFKFAVRVVNYTGTACDRNIFPRLTTSTELHYCNFHYSGVGFKFVLSKCSGSVVLHRFGSFTLAFSGYGLCNDCIPPYAGKPFLSFYFSSMMLRLNF